MIVQQIFENEDLVLDAESLSVAKQMKIKDPSLPFSVVADRLIFDAYTVGTIKVLDKVVNILPRNNAFTLSTIFEMILFSNDIIVNGEDTVGYDFINQNGIGAIPHYFSQKCKKLVDFGITGGYNNIAETSGCLNGNLVLEKFNKNIIKAEGLHYVKQYYTVDIPANQIIKSALLKLIRSGQERDSKHVYTSLLREFDAVSEYKGRIIDFEVNNSRFYSCNPFYPEVLEIALTILRDLKLSFSKGSIQWYSFLQNSNNLFEAYVRKLVSKTTELKVEKWEAPKNFAGISYNGQIGHKSYVPDILLGYESRNNTAKIVLDAKNKQFNPLNGKISELVDTADMFQLLFYCRKLKTNLGGLIYPARDDYEPASVIVDDDSDLRIVLLSVNMSIPYNKRLKKLKKDLACSLYGYL